MNDLRDRCVAARAAQRRVGLASAALRRAAIAQTASAVASREKEILGANEADLSALAADAPPAFRDRLRMDAKRVADLAAATRLVADLPDPIGAVLDEWTRPNGIRIEKVRVPIGLVAVIYESRPNVTIDAAAICLKAGNAVVLRGGKEAIRTSRVLAACLGDGLRAAGLPPEAVVFIDSPDRAEVTRLLEMTGIVDLVIPRGGEGLIARVVEAARVPVIYHGKGLCHLYLDRGADPEMAEKILLNAKTSRPGVCNAIETLLVHREATPHLARWAKALRVHGVALRCDPASHDALSRAGVDGLAVATEADWDAEYLDLVLSVRVVADIDEAIAHIALHGSGLAEAIVTREPAAAERFLGEVDASCVYHNASTRFTDGGEFGFGAEIGISTQKLHARGPMGPAELTTTRYLVRGTGQVR